MKRDDRMSEDHLQTTLRRAVEALGTGFLIHQRMLSSDVRDDILPAILQAAVVTAYRLIVLMHTRCCYSIPTRLQEVLAAGKTEKPEEVFSRSRFGLWEDLRALWLKLGSGWNEFAPALEVSDYCLASAIGLLAKISGSEGSENSPQTRLSVASIRHLGDSYESILDFVPEDTDQGMVLVKRKRGSGRKLSGSYYTPEHIVEDIVEHALGPLVYGTQGSSAGATKPLTSEGILDLKVLDPAMGSGHFLLAATDYLACAYARALRSEGKTRGSSSGSGDEDGGFRRLVAERCIYGVDVDPVAVEVARLSLWLFTAETGRPSVFPGKHLRCGNSLIGAGFGEDPACCSNPVGECGGVGAAAKGVPEHEPFHWELEFPETGLDSDGSRRPNPGFDAVIGNPPYLSLSGRQKAKGSEWMVSLSRAQGVGKGWVTAHGLFMLRAVQLARNSGFVSMVVPDQVGHLRGYSAVRAKMLREGRLIEVHYWGEDVFEDATTPVLTFVFQKSEPAADTGAAVIDRTGTRSWFSPGPGDEWSKTQSGEMYEKMLCRHPTLHGFGDPGVHTGNVARKLILSRPGRETLPVIEGKQIRPFRCDPPIRWLNTSYLRKAGEYFRVSPRRIYETTDILIRQTASRPIAARHLFRCYFRNSVLALKVPEGFSVEYLLGILNSQAAGVLYRASAFESGQRTFPQIKVRHLRSLPVPDPGLDENRSTVTRVEEIVSALEATEGPIDEQSPLIAELDRLVWGLYGLRAR